MVESNAESNVVESHAESNVVESDMLESNVMESNTVESIVAESNVVESNAVESNLLESNVAESNVVESQAMVDSHAMVESHAMVGSNRMESTIQTDDFIYDSISDTVVDAIDSDQYSFASAINSDGDYQNHAHSNLGLDSNGSGDAVTSMSLDSEDFPSVTNNFPKATPMSMTSSNSTSSMVSSDDDVSQTSSERNRFSRSLFSHLSRPSTGSEIPLSSEDEMERFDIEFAASRDSWSIDERNNTEETDSEEDDVTRFNQNFNFDLFFDKPKTKCTFFYEKDVNLDGQELKLKIQCNFETKNEKEFLNHSKTCSMRYKNKMDKSNPSLLARIIWEAAVTNDYGDHLAHEIQKSLLDKRSVKNLEVSDDYHTIKNCRIVKSPNFRDFLVLHRESSHNRRKSKDQCELNEEIFQQLIPTASSVVQIGETNKVRLIIPQFVTTVPWTVDWSGP